MMYEKKLYRSRRNRMIAGVCGGLGEYFKVDPNLIRLLWVLFSFAGGAGILAYIVAYFIIPERPRKLHCWNCGYLNRYDALYCQNCGKKLDEPILLTETEKEEQEKTG